MKEETASLPRHVVYRPKDLSALGRTKLGVVAWGNGGMLGPCREQPLPSARDRLTWVSRSEPPRFEAMKIFSA